MLAVCPSCRHTFQNEVQPVCSPCFDNKSNDHVPLILSTTIKLPSCKSAKCSVNIKKCTVNFTEDSYDLKDQRSRNTLSGGTVVKRDRDDQHSPTKTLTFPTIPNIDHFRLHILSNKLVNNFNSEQDLIRILESENYLKLSGWYHQGLSWKDATLLLMSAQVGTFLVRDSSDSKFLYSLTVQTKSGPFSIRIHYNNGQFRLDSDQDMGYLMPSFANVIQLVEFYAGATQDLPLNCAYMGAQGRIWIDFIGQIHSQIVLKKAMYVKNQVRSLKSLARLRINRSIRHRSLLNTLPVSAELQIYLQEYPYKY